MLLGTPTGFAVYCPEATLQPRAGELAGRLGCPLLTVAENMPDLVLERVLDTTPGAGPEPSRWQLRGHYPGAPQHALYVDFVTGRNAWRRRNPGAGKQPLARAFGIRHGHRPSILDATAGLGRDAFVLASLGCKVVLSERNPIIHTLLEDGLRRAREQQPGDPLFSRLMHLLPCTDGHNNPIPDSLSPQAVPGAALALLPAALDSAYFDPMYPEPQRRKKAAVKKDMQLLRHLLGSDSDAGEYLPLLRQRYLQVVAKRPHWASPLAADAHRSISTPEHCFDVYKQR